MIIGQPFVSAMRQMKVGSSRMKVNIPIKVFNNRYMVENQIITQIHKEFNES